ncbi:MAG: BBE domain-containing protein [Tabrizicola sp.]|nr:BBE domain-containing protein [Tabrizicola sp.]HMS95572.1 BBE domain-containing protein [Tabrizicola sp.]
MDGRFCPDFAGKDEDNADLARANLGRNFARQARIKDAYDPGNMFRFKQIIPPAA